MRSCPPPSSARRSRSASTLCGSVMASGFDRLRFLPILQEFLEADIRQRVVEQLIDDRRRTRGDIGAQPRRLDDVNRMAAAGDENLGGEIVVLVDVHDLANE